MTSKTHQKYFLASFIFLCFFGKAESLDSDSTELLNNLRMVLSVTNNGISLIPTFSLGKPAIIFDASLGRRLTFDPLIRYSLEGKPWSFIFWFRYKLIKSRRFQLNVGAHPAVLFRTVDGTINGVPAEILRARQYVVGELYPNYMFTKDFSVGVYYNYSRGLAKDDTKNTNFITFRTVFSNLKIFNNFSLSVVPQAYFLKMDDRDGFYVTSAFTIVKQNFPLSISSVINKTIESEIVSSDFVWNISLNYTLNKQYVTKLR